MIFNLSLNITVALRTEGEHSAPHVAFLLVVTPSLHLHVCALVQAVLLYVETHLIFKCSFKKLLKSRTCIFESTLSLSLTHLQ